MSINSIIKKGNTKIKQKELNELTYYSALHEDKRNIFKIFLSMLMMKIELIKIIFKPDEYSNRNFLFNLYIIKALIDLFMNCLLYSDYSISQKYHNNGTIKLITSITMALFSNIISFVLFFFINKLATYTPCVESIILNFNNKSQLIKSALKLFRIIEYKFIALLIIEILLGLFISYYLFIFGVIYSKTIISFLLNYILSQIESLSYSVGLCILASSMRKISLLYSWKRLYIISRYFIEHL